VAALTLSLGLGLSARELAELTCGDVYDARGSARPAMKVKAGRGRVRDVMIISPQVRDCLASYGETCLPWRSTAPTTPVFVSQKRCTLTANSMARFMTRLYREAGLVRATSMSGRRTLVVRLAREGAPLSSIATFIGRTDIRAVASQIDADPDDLVRALCSVAW
jgi:site-specific recombinase XerD